MYKLKSNKGFTLIEMVVVIAIIAILMLALVPKILGVQTQSKIAMDSASIHTVNSCIALHCAANNFDNLVGQTSINVFKPIKDGDSAETIAKFLQDKGLLNDTAKIYFPQGHSYSAASNEVS